MMEMVKTLKDAWKESPKTVITDALFVVGLFAFAYVVFYIHNKLV